MAFPNSVAPRLLEGRLALVTGAGRQTEMGTEDLEAIVGITDSPIFTLVSMKSPLVQTAAHFSWD